MIGMSLGSGLPAVVAAWLVPIFGWQALFVVGGIVPIIVALIIAVALPESLLFLTYRGRDRAELERRVKQLDPTLTITPDTEFALRKQPGEPQDARQPPRTVQGRPAVHHADAVAHVRLHAAVDAFHQQLDLRDAEPGRAVGSADGVHQWRAALGRHHRRDLHGVPAGAAGPDLGIHVAVAGPHRLLHHRHHRFLVAGAPDRGRLRGRASASSVARARSMPRRDLSIRCHAGQPASAPHWPWVGWAR